jgi:hypothetical protein
VGLRAAAVRHAGAQHRFAAIARPGQDWPAREKMVQYRGVPNYPPLRYRYIKASLARGNSRSTVFFSRISAGSRFVMFAENILRFVMFAA